MEEYITEAMEEIIKSIGNGQRPQALKQLERSTHSIDEMFDELIECNMEKEVGVMTRIAISSGYMSFNPANIRGV